MQLDNDNNVVASMTGAVWGGLPQSSQAAEYCARASVVQVVSANATLFGDCANVVRDGQQSFKAQTHYDRMFAGPNRFATKALAAA